MRPLYTRLFQYSIVFSSKKEAETHEKLLIKLCYWFSLFSKEDYELDLKCELLLPDDFRSKHLLRVMIFMKPKGGSGTEPISVHGDELDGGL